MDDYPFMSHLSLFGFFLDIKFAKAEILAISTSSEFGDSVDMVQNGINIYKYRAFSSQLHS
jgi:hypothetical protein